jgi:RNA polymerase sigma factor (sigma-70 family)
MESSESQSSDRLLMRAKEGNRSALDRLMASCRPWLRSRVRARLPGGLARKQDGSDLVQECQYMAVAQFAEFEGRSLPEFRAWIAGILDRRVLHALRFWRQGRRDRRREEPLNPVQDPGAVPAQGSTSILERLSREEDFERLERATSWCREEDRALIALHLLEDRSHDEIAAEWGVAAATVRQRYCRAVRRVGDAMRLLELMSRRGLGALQQDVIGLHRFQGAAPGQIADRLRLPEDLVACWIAEAGPLLRSPWRDGT